MRAVESVWFRNFLHNLGLSKERYDSAVTRTTSGKKLNKLSDNPADMAQVMTLRGRLAQISQFDRNINSGEKSLAAAESALNNSVKHIHQVVSLAAQGASGLTSHEQRRIIADQVDLIRDALLDIANTQIDGKFVFSGSNTTIRPFVLSEGTVSYRGNDQYVEAQADFSVRVATNIPGSQVFTATRIGPGTLLSVDGSGTGLTFDTDISGLLNVGDLININGENRVITSISSPFSVVLESPFSETPLTPSQWSYNRDPGQVDLFQRLADLSAALRNDDTEAIGNSISTMKEVSNSFNSALGHIGNRRGHLQEIKQLLRDFSLTLTTQMSGMEDADMAAAITDLANEEIGLSAMLRTGARINRVSLMDFLG